MVKSNLTYFECQQAVAVILKWMEIFHCGPALAKRARVRLQSLEKSKTMITLNNFDK